MHLLALILCGVLLFLCPLVVVFHGETSNRLGSAIEFAMLMVIFIRLLQLS